VPCTKISPREDAPRRCIREGNEGVREGDRGSEASLALDSAVTGSLTVVGTALGLAAVLLWTRELPPEAYAALGTFLLVGQVGRTLLASYSQTALLHYGRLEFLERGGAQGSFWAALWLSTPTLLLGAAAGILLRGPLSLYLSGGDLSVLLVEAYMLVLAITGLQVHRLQAEGRFGLAASISVLDRALIIAAALVLSLSSGITADRARLIVLGAAAASLGLGLIVRPPGPPRLEAVRLLPMARFSASIAVCVGMGTLFAWGDFGVASRWLSAKDLGCYYLASQCLTVLLQLSQVVGIVSGPLTISLIARGQVERARQLFRRGASQLSLLTSAFLGILIACTCLLLPILIPDSYAPTLEPLVLLIAAGATAPLYFFSQSIFNAYRRPDLITAATVVLAGSNLALSLVLVPSYGATGAAIAKGLSLGVGALYACGRALKLLDVAWPPGLLLALTPALVAVGAVLWHPSQFGAVAAAALSIVAAAAALRYGKLLQPDDIGRLQSVGFPNWTRSMLQMALRVTS